MKLTVEGYESSECIWTYGKCHSDKQAATDRRVADWEGNSLVRHISTVGAGPSTCSITLFVDFQRLSLPRSTA